MMEVINLKDHGDKFRDAYGDIIHYSFRGWSKQSAVEAYDLMEYDETVLGVVDDDELLSVLIINDYQVNLNGHTVGMGGIGAVSTLGPHRNKGSVSMCLHESLREMYDRGYVISMLGPFKYEFYRKYGWELGISSYTLTFPVEHTQRFEYEGEFKLIKSKEEYPILDEIYQRYAKDHNCTVIRTKKLWERKFAGFETGDTTMAYYVDENGNKTAYAVFSISPSDECMYVSELVYDTVEDLRAFMGFFRSHSAQCKKIRIQNICTPDDVVDIMPSKMIDASYYQGMMNRVINAEKALELYPYTADGTVSVSVTDPILDANFSTFVIDVKDGKAVSVRRTEDEGDMIIDVRELTQLVTGYRNVADILRVNRVRVKNDKARHFFGYKNTCALYDFF